MSLDLSIIVAFLVVSFLIGVWERKRITLDDYWVNSRRTGPFTVTATMLSTFIGTGSLLALATVAYRGGIAALILGGSFTLYFLLFAFILAPRLKRVGDRLQAYTLPDIFRVRYGKAVGLITALLNLTIFLLFLAEQFVGGGAFLAQFTGAPLLGATLSAGLVLIAYTAVGGLRADIRTDVFQFCIMFVLLMVFLPLLWQKSGGWMTLRSLPEALWTGSGFASPGIILAGFLTLGMTTMTSMDVWQRAFAARDESAARWGMAGAAALTFPFFLLATLMGMFGAALFPELPDPNGLVPRELTEILPIGLRGLTLAGFFAAIMSSADTCLLIVSQTLVNDFYLKGRGVVLPPERVLVLSRIVTLVVGVAALLVAALVLSIFHLAIGATSLGVALIPATLGAFFWKRSTATAAFWSIALGALTVLFVFPRLGQESFLPGVIVSACVFVTLSFLTGHRAEEQTL